MRPFFSNIPHVSPHLGPERQAPRDSAAANRQGGSAITPFLLEHRSRDVQPDGSFKPDTRVSLSSDLGASGLLRSLLSDELATLLLVLSTVTPSGGFVATPEILAPLAGISRMVMRRRLDRLAALEWQGRPLVTITVAESGMRLYAPSTLLFETQRSAVLPIARDAQARDAMPSPAAQPLPPSRREESIARSRQLYARPRAEVEGAIERFLSGGVPDYENGAGGDGPLLMPSAAESGNATEKTGKQQASEGRRWLALKKRLFAVGLSHAQAQTLLDGYPFDLIERQLVWLPHREARRPVAYLLAAVAGDYAPPRSLAQAADREPPIRAERTTETAYDLNRDD